MLRVTHNSGFYSCCTVRLNSIIGYYNTHKKFPDKVDSSIQFAQYKTNINEDISHLFFIEDLNITEKDVRSIEDKKICDWVEQFCSYKNQSRLDELKPFIQKYFTVTECIKTFVHYFENKYNINYNNICAVFYRGNDKIIETNQPSYEEMFNKATEIYNNNKNIQFLVQTDVTEFANEFKNKFNNVIHFNEIPTISNNNLSAVQYCVLPEYRLQSILLYNAAIQIISKCKYVICTSGNGELWIMLYRGHTEGVHQYLKTKEYDVTQTNFWI